MLKCLICRRPLKSHRSIDRQMGPTCYRNTRDQLELFNNKIFKEDKNAKHDA